MALFQTAGAPPSSGSAIRATIGCTWKSRNEPAKVVRTNGARGTTRAGAARGMGGREPTATEVATPARSQPWGAVRAGTLPFRPIGGAAWPVRAIWTRRSRRNWHARAVTGSRARGWAAGLVLMGIYLALVRIASFP